MSDRAKTLATKPQPPPGWSKRESSVAADAPPVDEATRRTQTLATRPQPPPGWTGQKVQESSNTRNLSQESPPESSLRISTFSADRNRSEVLATKPAPPPGWSQTLQDAQAEAVAAGKLQKAYRKRCEKLTVRIVDFRYTLTEKMIEHLITSNFHNQVKEDPWMPHGQQDAIIGKLTWLSAEVHARAKASQMEIVRGKAGALLRKTIREHLKPESWPPPPPWWPNPLRRLRARLLYAIWPADKNETYMIKVAPWMLALNLGLLAPFGVGVSLWNLLALCVLFCDDEYLLFDYIAKFKTYALLFWGVLPVYSDWAMFYLAFTSGAREGGSCSSGGPSTDAVTLLEDRLFCLAWVMCWVVFGRFVHVRRAHRRGVLRSVYTGDDETGDAEVWAVMRWDVGATAAVVLLGCADLTYRILHGRYFADYFVVLWRDILLNHGGVMVNDVVGLSHGAKLFTACLTLGLGFSALPFALFKLPLGELIHQMRPTGFDEAARPRLKLSLQEMGKLKRAREAEQDKRARRGTAPSNRSGGDSALL